MRWDSEGSEGTAPRRRAAGGGDTRLRSVCQASQRRAAAGAVAARAAYSSARSPSTNSRQGSGSRRESRATVQRGSGALT